MTEYIKKERAKEAVLKALALIAGGCPAHQSIRDTVTEAIDRMQKEDISPRKSAQWGPHESIERITEIRCSNCFYALGYDDLGTYNETNRPRYCPNCGAYMYREGRLKS